MSNNTQVSAAQSVAVLPQKQGKKSLVAKFAERFNVDGEKLFDTLKATAFKQSNGEPPTNHQMMALMIVADQYKLNPFTKEIYAFPDKNNGIIPIVGIDGWSTIINNHPQFDGMEFRFSDTTIQLEGVDDPIYEWIECIIHRKDRNKSTPIREYLRELYRPPTSKMGRNGAYTTKGPWQTHPKRLSRHKVIIQAARIVFGYSGIYDEDEAQRIIDAQATVVSSQPAIQFDSEPQVQSAPAIESKAEPVVLDDSDSEFFEDMDDSIPMAEQPEVRENEVFNTSFGDVPKKDAKMITQMVEFTIQQGSWDTTRDSFKERYDGATLEFALSELNNAFNEAFSEE